MIYDYRKASKEDVKWYITENFDEEEIREKISDHDELEEE